MGTLTTEQELLVKALGALDAACWLLDKQCGGRGWRDHWAIADVAEGIRAEVHRMGACEPTEGSDGATYYLPGRSNWTS